MATDPRLGTELGQYLLEDTIGRGGMGVVYLGRDLRLDRRVAVKVMTPDLAGDAAFRERFEREARMAAAIDHPNIIPIYDSGEQGGDLYLAMRYVQGTDLRTLLVEGGALPTDRAMGIVRQVASALDAAHEQGIVHRDVKPANILLASGTGTDETDHVYLTDFGLTKRFSQASRALTATGQFVGTIDYVAPEQVEGQTLDGRADQYSLACVLFECLTGAVVFGETSDVATLFAHVHQPPPPLTSLRPDLPMEVDEVVGRALAKRREERFDTCGEFVHRMRDALATWGPRRAVHGEQDTVAAPPPSPPTPPLPQAPPAPPVRPEEAKPRVPPAPPRRPPAEAEPRPPVPPEPSRPRSRTPILVGGIVAAVLVAGGLVFALTRGGGAPDGTHSTGPTTPSGRPVGPQLAWTSLPRATLQGLGTRDLRAVATVPSPGPLGNTLVAAGWAPPGGGATGPDPAVWLSSDGLTWTPAPGQPALAEAGRQAIRGVSGAGHGVLVAVGSNGPPGSGDAAVWLSSDGGEHWSSVTGSEDQFGGAGAQSMNRVAKPGGTVMAVGFDTAPGGDRDGAIWTSEDGSQWTEITGGDLGGPGDQEVDRVSKIPGGTSLLAAGSSTGSGGDSDGAVWRSDDGRTWVRVDAPDLGGPGDQAINDLQTLGDLLIAGGFDDAHGDGRDAALWVSSDGTTWTEITGGALGGAGDQVVSRVYPTESTTTGLPRLVAGGFEVVDGDRNAALWYSNDGRTWTRETASQARLGGPGDQEIESIVAVGHAFPLVAVGRNGPDAGMWSANARARG